MKSGVFTISCFLSVFIATAGFAQQSGDIIVDFVGDPWTPWVYGSEGSFTDKGIAVEVILEIFKRIDGYQPVFSLHSWDECLELVRAGDADALILCAYNTERAGYAVFTDEIVRNKAVFLFRKGEMPQWTVLQDLKKYRIGILSGNDYGTIFDKARLEFGYSVNNGATSMDEALVLLKDNYFDILLTTEAVLTEVYKSNPRNKDVFGVAGSPFSDGDVYYIAFSRKSGKANLIPKMNTIIAQIKAEGIIDKLRSKYLGK